MKRNNEVPYSELSRQYEGFSIDDMPANWEDCTRSQLAWLAEHGSYGQRLIAGRWLRDLPADTNAARAEAKRQGPPPKGPL